MTWKECRWELVDDWNVDECCGTWASYEASDCAYWDLCFLSESPVAAPGLHAKGGCPWLGFDLNQAEDAKSASFRAHAGFASSPGNHNVSIAERARPLCQRVVAPADDNSAALASCDRSRVIASKEISSLVKVWLQVWL